MKIIIDIIQCILVLATLITTIVLYFKQNNHNKRETLDKQLQELQKMSFHDPFLEDFNYTNNWNQMRELYLNNSLTYEDRQKFLKYDTYTEMIFNFLESSYKEYGTEEKLLDCIDFKSWLRTHSECWKNPLQAHSNREVYGKKICDMVDDWLK